MSDQTPAFPVPMITLPNGSTENAYDPGMTMRQWYKGMALQGLLSSKLINLDKAKTGSEQAQLVSIFSGSIADAMLAEDAEHDSTGKGE